MTYDTRTPYWLPPMGRRHKLWYWFRQQVRFLKTVNPWRLK